MIMSDKRVVSVEALDVRLLGLGQLSLASLRLRRRDGRRRGLWRIR